MESFLLEYSSVCLLDGRKAVVRNGCLPPRMIQTGIGDIEVQVPKVRNRSGGGAKFNSSLVPPYLKKTKSTNEFLPWLYLKGISSGDYQEALGSILGKDAVGLSAKTISRIYLCQIRDIASGIVLSSSMSSRIKAELVKDTIQKAVRYWAIPHDCIFHSDRGSQYTSGGVMELLRKQGLHQSFSRVGTPGDNARSESFFANLKKEAIGMQNKRNVWFNFLSENMLTTPHLHCAF